MRVTLGTPEQEAMCIVMGRLQGLPGGCGYSREQATYQAAERLVSMIAAAPEMRAELETLCMDINSVVDNAGEWGQSRTRIHLFAMQQRAIELLNRVDARIDGQDGGT